MDLLCTTCSAEKRRDEGERPAIERYLGPRIRALARRAQRLGRPMVILSGRFGLLDPATPIPWYDHALASGEVAALAPRIATRLVERRARRVVFFARPPATPGWLPYHEAMARACAAAGVELEVADAAAELVGFEPALAARLFDLAERDQRARARLAASGGLFDGYHPEMEAVHRANAAELESILDAVGWPGRPRVGAEGAHAAWIVAQHAISLPDLQRRCRRLLDDAVTAGEADPAHLACLVDRIRFNEGRPQRYGTIFDWDADGRLSPWTVERPETVEERRAAVGLPPLAPSIVEARLHATEEGEGPPANLADRRRQIDEWRRAVGWRAPKA